MSGKFISKAQIAKIKKDERMLRSCAKRNGKKIVGFNHQNWGNGDVSTFPIYEKVNGIKKHPLY